MIHKKRILNTENHLIGIAENEMFFIGCDVDQVDSHILKRAGFNLPVREGEQILPAIVGSVSKHNAEGGFKKEEDKPKEIKYRQIAIKDWHGNLQYVDIPYKRYQRSILYPPSIELRIVHKNSKQIILSPQLIRSKDNNEIIKHVFNLFLELFGSCYVLNNNLIPNIGNIPVKRVNWEILPKGEYPWEKVKSLVNEYTQSLNNSRKTLIKKRIDVLSKYNLSEIIIGKGGFNGYWILKFKDMDFYVLESLYYGQATYILGDNWEVISQLSKREILERELNEARIIHDKNWEAEINRLLG